MDEVQSWWEVPCIAHFCSLFRTSFDLPDFDIEELEEALLTDSVEEVGSGLLQDLIVRLLKGSLNIQQDEITTSNYQMFLRRLFRIKCEVDVTRKNPFDSDVAFFSLPLRTKVEILNDLCDFRLDADDIIELLKSIEAESLRVEPLGQDSGGSTYWYFYGTRLYREDYHTIHKSPPKKRGRKIEEKTVSKWQVVCFTEEDWHLLTSKFKNCKHKDERSLYTTLREDFLPELSRLFAEKERVMRKRMMDKQLRRSRKESSPPPASSLQNVEGDELRKQRLEQEEADRRLAEEIQRQEAAAGRDLRERRGGRGRNSASHTSAASPKNRKREKSGSGGRMTNNSMCALLLAGKEGSADGTVQDNDSNSGDEDPNEEQKPKKKKIKASKEQNPVAGSKSGSSKTKVKSSVIFSASEEDVQIGMHKVIEFIKVHRDAWPFVGPVDENFAPNYYKVIREPMDLQTIEDKLDNQEYLTLDQFRSDFQLIVRNCHKYNGDSSEYSEMVDSLADAFHKVVTRFIIPDDSDEEISIEYSTPHERNKSRVSQSAKRSPVKSRQSTDAPMVKITNNKSEDEMCSSPPPKKKRKKKRSKSPTEKERIRSDVENSDDEARLKKKRAKQSSHKKVKELKEDKIKERPKEQREVNPKDRPVKKRPRESSPLAASYPPPFLPEEPPSPSVKHHRHHHHHHHKHSKSHEKREKAVEPLPKKQPAGAVGTKTMSHREKEERRPPTVVPQFITPQPPVTALPTPVKKVEPTKPKAKTKMVPVSGLSGFKNTSILNHMKRLQVGKATKFKIKPSSTPHIDDKLKKFSSLLPPTNVSGGPGSGDNGKVEETDKKQSILLNNNSSQRLSFGTVLPKHALPLRDFKPNQSEDEEDEGKVHAEPLPQNPTEKEILDRLEKTFGASLARATKDQLAKVILAPDSTEGSNKEGSPKEGSEENSARLELSKGFNREKSLPNLSAWFKAFGAPKVTSPTTPTAVEKEKEASEISPHTPLTPSKPSEFSLMGRRVGVMAALHAKQARFAREFQLPPIAKEEAKSSPPPQQQLVKEEEEKVDVERKRRMSASSSVSSHSEVGSPSVVETQLSSAAPRWVENRSEAWVSGSPSASSQVSSQSPAGPNSPFSPPINSPPTPQTPPRPPAPVRVGFYQDYSVHSSPEKSGDLNVSSPATPPPASYGLKRNATYHHAANYGSSPSPSPSLASQVKQIDESSSSPVQSPQYANQRTANYDSGRASKEPPPPTPPQSSYGIFPEAAHSGSSRYSMPPTAPAHPRAEPQAAHQYSREAYSHGRVGANEGQHYGNPAYSHPPRPMNLYNSANERFYKSEGIGLPMLTTTASSSAPSAVSTTTGKARKEKEKQQAQPQQQQQPEQQLSTVNGFQWPHNLASLTQIVNSIPNAMTGYMNASPHGHYPHEAHGYTSLGNNRAELAKNENPTAAASPAPTGRRSTGSKGSSESKQNSRSSSGSKNRSNEAVSGNPPPTGMVPGSAFNFSSLTPPELALYSKEMSEYTNSQPSIAHAHHRSDLYSSSPSNFHPSPFSGGSSVRGTSSYQLGAFHPSAYPSNPSQNYTTAPRGMVDPYQGLFQGSPHVMGLLPPSGYPPPYPHPHSLPFPNRPGGWM